MLFCLFGITVFHILTYYFEWSHYCYAAILGVVLERTAYRPLRDAPKIPVLNFCYRRFILLENWLITYSAAVRCF